MSEIMHERLKKSIGKEIKLFLINDFRYVGKIINCDELYLEILDYRSESFKIILLTEIKDIEVKE